jgi:hypothetical protein
MMCCRGTCCFWGDSVLGLLKKIKKVHQDQELTIGALAGVVVNSPSQQLAFRQCYY